MLLIDTHAHLNEIEDIEGALFRARQNGVYKIVAIGMDLESNRITLELAERFPDMILPAIGYHPWSIVPEEIDRNLSFVEDHLDLCVALGEIGLDYRAKVKKKVQWEVFSRLLAIAAARRQPVVVHSRFSHERTYRMVKEAGLAKAVFHWYSGSREILEQIISDGYLVSATPALVYSRSHRDAIQFAPLEQVLIETDAPVEYQDQVSEPVNVVDTLRELSRMKEMPQEQVARITTANAERFFQIQTSVASDVRSPGRTTRSAAQG